MTNKSIAILAFLGVFVILFTFKFCKTAKEVVQITDSTAHVAKYQKSILDKEVKILKDTEYIYLDRWHKSKDVTIHLFDTIYASSPDTCHTYINELQNAVLIEQKAAQLVRSTDSLIIVGLDSVIKIDSLLMVKQKQDYQTLLDSIPKIKRKSKWKGAKIGAAVLGGLELIGGVILMVKP